MQESELEVLQRIYKLSNGLAGQSFKRKKLIELLGLPERESETILDALARQGMLRRVLFASLSLTHLGVAAVDKSTAPNTGLPRRESGLRLSAFAPDKSKTAHSCAACKGAGRSKCGRCSGFGSFSGVKTIMETKTFPRTEYYTDYRGQRQSRTTYDTRTTPKTVPDRKTCMTCHGSGKVKCAVCGGTGQART